MKAESGGSVEEPGKELGSVQQEARTCPVCGTKFFATADSGFCPVCMLRGATGGESAPTGEPGSVSGSADSPGETEGASQARRFEHYEVMLDENGTPIELGRGAMGVTYKALDVDLRCPVTLKVISERYLGDESARLRFLREARATASIRHPNVASVLHSAEPEAVTFYIMEVVEVFSGDGAAFPSGNQPLRHTPWMPLNCNADGSLDVYMQAESPGKDEEANWLATPLSGPFNIKISQLLAQKRGA